MSFEVFNRPTPQRPRSALPLATVAANGKAIRFNMPAIQLILPGMESAQLWFDRDSKGWAVSFSPARDATDSYKISRAQSGAWLTCESFITHARLWPGSRYALLDPDDGLYVAKPQP